MGQRPKSYVLQLRVLQGWNAGTTNNFLEGDAPFQNPNAWLPLFCVRCCMLRIQKHQREILTINGRMHALRS